MNARCHRHLLSQTSTCLVEACSCGALHLSVGAMTLRLDREAAEDIAQALVDAVAAIQLRSMENPARHNSRH
jgi:hypothetical protein